MEWLLVGALAVVGVVVLVWAARVGGNQGGGLSDADRYRLELARRAAAALPTSRGTQGGPVPGRGAPGRAGQGQNATHGQNLPGSGQNASHRPAPSSPRPLNPEFVAYLQGLVHTGQASVAVRQLQEKTGIPEHEARAFLEKLRQ
ncbi:MAG: hypothetical protein JWO93_2479 [Micrococcaceae bacterium]|jgi:hypothetical protein|nr:hypothetical protein [Micrococcaceae bacterium]